MKKVIRLFRWLFAKKIIKQDGDVNPASYR